MQENINSKCMPWGRNSNPLLLKAALGSSKPGGVDLPPSDYAYGRPSGKDGQGVEFLKSYKRGGQQDPPIKLVTNNWQDNKANQQTKGERNFIELNRLQSAAKVVTAKQSTEFRKHHDSTKKQLKGNKAYKIVLPEEQFRYGIQNRPSTPVKLVIGNCYGTEAQAMQDEVYKVINAKRAEKHCPESRMTRTQLLRNNKVGQKLEYINREEHPQKFKITKFTQHSTTKVNTNRGPWPQQQAIPKP